MFLLYISERSFGYRQPTFISPLSLGFALHTIEEGVFCREMIKGLLQKITMRQTQSALLLLGVKLFIWPEISGGDTRLFHL